MTFYIKLQLNQNICKIKLVNRQIDLLEYMMELDIQHCLALENIIHKIGITCIFCRYFANLKDYSYDSLPIENILTLYNVVICIKSVLNKDKNHYQHKIFLEKCSYQLAKKKSQKHFLQYNNASIWREIIAKEKFYAPKKTMKI